MNLPFCWAKMKLTYNGTVSDGGILKIIHRARFDEDLKLFAGKEISITLTKKVRQRSNNQNRYYWGAVIPIVKQAMYDAGIIANSLEVHDLLKCNCNLKDVINTKTGLIKQIPGTTANLTTSEFMDYMVRVREFVIEFLNTEIPEPNEQNELFLSDQPDAVS